MSVNSIYKLLDKLEVMILQGLPIPFSPFVIINNEKIIDVLDKIRASIPGEIQEAHGIMRKSEEIQIESQRRAEMLLKEAKNEAERVLSESELLKAVQDEANKLREDVISEAESIKTNAIEEAKDIKVSAAHEAIKIREGADQYAENLLSKLDGDLSDMHAIVQNGQRHMEAAKAEAMEAYGLEEEEEIVEESPRTLSYKINK